MKTLAELKREAKTGKLSGEMIYWYGDKVPERLQGKRKIVDANSVGVFFLNSNGKKSELRVEKASLIDYDGENLTTYKPGKREMNQEERAIMADWEKVTETEEYKSQCKYDAMTDCGGTYWKQKAFFENRGFAYLTGYDFSQGKKYDHETGFIIDKSIKGDKELQYKIYQE